MKSDWTHWFDLSRNAELKEGEVIGEKRLKELLAEVDLEYLVEREGGTEAVVDWGSQLSLGEQQRLGMARLFYHTPKFAILDECTSGVTVSSLFSGSRKNPSSSNFAPLQRPS